MEFDAIHLLSVASVLVSAIYLGFGVFILRSNPTERLNQIFSLICASLFCWSFAHACRPEAAATGRLWFGVRLSAVGWTLTPALLLHFFLLLAERGAWLGRRWFLPGLYLTALFFLGQAIFGEMGVVDFVWTDYGWSDVYGPLTLTFAAF